MKQRILRAESPPGKSLRRGTGFQHHCGVVPSPVVGRPKHLWDDVLGLGMPEQRAAGTAEANLWQGKGSTLYPDRPSGRKLIATP
jgi:hypothetical protein